MTVATRADLALGEVNKPIACWSERGRLERVALCRPATLAVATTEEAIAVGFRDTMRIEQAEMAYDRLRQVLEKHGCEVAELTDYMTPHELRISSMFVNRIFVRDVGAVVGECLIAGTASLPSRAAEFEMARGALKAAGVAPAHALTQVSVEFGDVFLLDPETLLINFGTRSDKAYARSAIETALECGFSEVVAVSVPRDLNIIHLDLAFNVPGSDTILARPFLRHLPLRCSRIGRDATWTTFDDFFARRRQSITWCTAKPSDDYLTNYIYLDDRLILASTSVAERLRSATRALGIDVTSVDLQAYERGNGSVRCATLPLLRRETHTRLATEDLSRGTSLI